jgi:hypothetical protein
MEEMVGAVVGARNKEPLATPRALKAWGTLEGTVLAMLKQGRTVVAEVGQAG